MQKTAYFSTEQGAEFFKLMVSTDRSFRKLFVHVVSGKLSHDTYRELHNGWEDFLREHIVFLSNLASEIPRLNLSSDGQILIPKTFLAETKRVGKKREISLSSGLGKSLFTSFVHTENFFKVASEAAISGAVPFEFYANLALQFREHFANLNAAVQNLVDLERRLSGGKNGH